MNTQKASEKKAAPWLINVITGLALIGAFDSALDSVVYSLMNPQHNQAISTSTSVALWLFPLTATMIYLGIPAFRRLRLIPYTTTWQQTLVGLVMSGALFVILLNQFSAFTPVWFVIGTLENAVTSYALFVFITSS